MKFTITKKETNETFNVESKKVKDENTINPILAKKLAAIKDAEEKENFLAAFAGKESDAKEGDEKEPKPDEKPEKEEKEEKEEKAELTAKEIKALKKLVDKVPELLALVEDKPEKSDKDDKDGKDEGKDDKKEEGKKPTEKDDVGVFMEKADLENIEGGEDFDAGEPEDDGITDCDTGIHDSIVSIENRQVSDDSVTDDVADAFAAYYKKHLNK